MLAGRNDATLYAGVAHNQQTERRRRKHRRLLSESKRRQTVVLVRRRCLEVPAQSEVQSEVVGHAPIVLSKQTSLPVIV